MGSSHYLLGPSHAAGHTLDLISASGQRQDSPRFLWGTSVTLFAQTDNFFVMFRFVSLENDKAIATTAFKCPL